MKKRFFFHKILLTYSALVCVLVFFVFCAFMLHLKSSDQKRLFKAQVESVTVCMENWEKEFSYIYNIAQSVKSLPTFDRVALCTQNEYYPSMTALFDDLCKLDRLISDKGYSVAVHKFNGDTAVTNTGTRNINYLLDDLNLSAAQYKQILKNASAENLYHENYIWTDEMLLFVSEKDFIDSRMIITLYAPLDRLLPFLSSRQTNISLLFDDSKITDLRVNTRPSFALPQTITAGENTLQPQEETVGNVRYQFMKSYFLNLYYAYPLPTVPADTLALFALQMGIALLAICFVSYLIVRAFSVKLYRPIDRLFNAFVESGGEGEITDKDNEIEFMTHRVMQIRSVNRELTHKLETSNQILRERLLRGALIGRINSSEMRTSVKKFGLEWLNQPLTLVLFEPAEAGETVLDALSDNLAPILEKFLAEKIICHRVMAEPTEICFLVPGLASEQLKEILAEVINAMDTEFRLPVCAFLGPVSACFEELPFALSGARRLRDNRSRLPIRNLYEWDDIEMLSNECVVYPIQIEAELLHALESGEDVQAYKLLDVLFEEYIKRTFDNRDLRDMIIFALTNTINRAFEQALISSTQVSSQGKYLFMELRSCENVCALKRYVQCQLDKILEEIRLRNEKKGGGLREALQQYVAQNYPKDFSLLDLADHFKLSPNYMSAIFKSTMGDNFKDYLSQVRFDHAVQLLRSQPDIKLMDLGEQVGITNVNTLIRMFKKFTGLAPRQYIHQQIKT